LRNKQCSLCCEELFSPSTERKKNKKLKEELSKIKESIQDPEETKKSFMDIKVKLEEAKMIKQTLKNNCKKMKG
jgi:hypothetical protein